MTDRRLRFEVQHLNSTKVLHMGTHYRHLTEVDRVNIDTMLTAGWSQRFIAQALGFSPSTISREIKRAAVPGCWRYFAPFGQRAHREARRRAGLVLCPANNWH